MVSFNIYFLTLSYNMEARKPTDFIFCCGNIPHSSKALLQDLFDIVQGVIVGLVISVSPFLLRYLTSVGDGIHH